MVKPSLCIEAEPVTLASAVRDLVAQFAHEAVRQRGRFSLALSGGSTPRRTYTAIARVPELPWRQMHFFFGDERHVPPDDKDSNYRMAKETLFDIAQVPAANVHRVHGEEPDAAKAAELYEANLREYFVTEHDREFPRFDVQLLGLGPDGHTASLFPGTPVLHEQKRWVMSQRVETLKTDRITLTLPVLNASRAVIFLAQGEDKADAVREVLEGTRPVDEIPARGVQPDPGGIWWFLDEAAASTLSESCRGRRNRR